MAEFVKRHRAGGWAALIVVAFIIVNLTHNGPAQARLGDKIYPIVVPGLKYEGNASCAASGCHAEDAAWEQSGQMIGDESNIWAASDPHAFAYETLTNEDSKAIAAKLDIADATASARCLDCHAMNASASQRGNLFSLKNDAVGCESCHGPAEKYLNPHAEEGWTTQQRAALGAQGLIDQHGLIDTSHLGVRANTCVACHLQIDKDMIDAGHPPLSFEMYSYNYYFPFFSDAAYAVHWNDQRGVMTDARLWAAGQAAGRVAAKAQVDAWKKKGWDTADAEAILKVYDAGFEIAKKHFGADTVQGLAEKQPTAAQVAAAAADLAATADLAVTKQLRATIGSGVAALGSAAFEAKGEAPADAFWTAYATATNGEGGDAYKAALKTMADLAK